VKFIAKKISREERIPRISPETDLNAKKKSNFLTKPKGTEMACRMEVNNQFRGLFTLSEDIILIWFKY
jgi:hypothetical protein